MNELEKLEKTLCVLMRQANEIKKENAQLKEKVKRLEKLKEAICCMDFLREPDEGKYYHVSEKDFERIEKIYRDL